MIEVGLLDMGMGNLASVERALMRAGVSSTRVREADEVRRCARLVAPGQGHFAGCARALDDGLGDAVLELIAAGRPFFGICLGMQMLFERSEEAPGARGLGVLGGDVKRIPSDLLDDDTGRPVKIPHMGWSACQSERAELRQTFYFIHSFVCVPADPRIVVAYARHGSELCVAVERDNVFAVQFHPEKSGEAGARLLEARLRDRWS
jgi:imidazole glycerol-phosphate synthase subunit HisH